MEDSLYKSIIMKSSIGYAYHRVIVDQLGEPIDYEFVEVNRAFGEITGLDVESIIGQTYNGMGFVDKEFDWVKFYGEIGLKGGDIEFEQYSNVIKKHFKIRVFSPVKGYFVTVFNDIIETEFELRTVRERLELAMEAGEHGFWDWNKITDQVYYSPSYFTMLGYQDGELPMTKDTWVNLMHPEDREKVIPVILDHIDKCRNFDEEFRLRCKDGSYKWISGRGRGYRRDADGELYRAVGIHVDISKIKSTEAELLKAKDRAEKAYMVKAQFLANMSHEIRTPLNGLIGMLQLLQTTALTEEQQNYINISKVASTQLLRTINDILDYSKLEAGKILLEEQRISIDGFIKDIVDFFGVTVYSKPVSILVSVGRDFKEDVLGDEFRLRQILSNLLGNAIKFTDKGDIEVRVEIMSKDISSSTLELLWTVKDSGIGMNQEFAEAIFDLYVQGGVSTSRLYGGAGLGLSISKGLVELMGGRIWVESELGKGSTFYFTSKHRVYKD